MVSTTRAWKSGHPERMWSRALLLTLLVLVATHAWAADRFTVEQATTRLEQGVYLLDAQIAMEFSRDATEALNNGVPLTLMLDIRIDRMRNWWLDDDIAELQQRYQITYYALSDQYLVRNLNTSTVYSYPSLDAAVEALGTLQGFPLLDSELLENEEEYEVLMRMQLDLDALPMPLRVVAYVQKAWRMSSDWSAWSLTP